MSIGFSKQKTISIIVYLLLSSLIVVFSIGYMAFSAFERQEEEWLNLIEDSDLRYIREVIGKGRWHIKDGFLYVNDTCLGNGTKEKSNVGIFSDYAEKTGAHCYIYKRCSDDIEGWIDDPEVLSGKYYAGHYLCVCDSMNNASDTYVGWPVSKSIADTVEKNGICNKTDYYKSANGIVLRSFRIVGVKDSDDDSQNGDYVALIAVVRNLDDSETFIEKTSLHVALISIALIIIFGLGLCRLFSTQIKDIDKLIVYLSSIGTERFKNEPIVLSNGMMSEIANAVNSMVSALQEKDRLQKELKVAAGIQKSMLPNDFNIFEKYKEFSVCADMVPAKEVGGDFYDVFMTDENHLAMVIADVSGKGVPAAMFMAVTRTLIRNSIIAGITVDKTFTKVNAFLCNDNKEEMFVTAWLGILNLETGHLTYANAGHNPPLLYCNGKFEYMKMKSGFVLAAMDGYQYKQYELQFEPGDKIVLYTDGVTEATDINGSLFGNRRFVELVNENKNKSPNELIDVIYANVNEFQKNVEQADDVTVLAIEFNKKMNLFACEKEFDSNRKQLDEAITFVEAYLEELECSMKFIMQVSTAVEEIFLNIVDYAYKIDKGKITVAIGHDEAENSVILRFTDTSYAFNPLELKNPETNLSAEERSEGGLGIFMVKNIMDNVDYKRFGEKNILTMKKKIS